MLASRRSIAANLAKTRPIDRVTPQSVIVPVLISLSSPGWNWNLCSKIETVPP